MLYKMLHVVKWYICKKADGKWIKIRNLLDRLGNAREERVFMGTHAIMYII